MIKTLEVEVAQALKAVAQNDEVNAYIQQSRDLYPLLLKAAKRFVAGENKQDGIEIANDLISKGYFISLEYLGENIIDLEQCIEAKDEYLNLIEEMGFKSMNQTVSLNFSNIGLSVNPELAYNHLLQIVQKANQYGITLMISMEESSKTNDILEMYKKTSEQYPNVGITIQAHLYRSNNDIKELIRYPGKIRVVKGAYQESLEISMSRSKELNSAYLNLVDQLIEVNHPISIATHDETLIQELEHRQSLNRPNVELEMLYGISPVLLGNLNSKGYKCKVYVPYGKEWYLYLCHRLAEYPENLYQAVIDMIFPYLQERNN